KISKNWSIKVGQLKTETVGMAYMQNVGLAKMMTIGMAYNVNVGVSMLLNVGMSRSVTVGQTQTSKVGKTYGVDVGERYQLQAGTAGEPSAAPAAGSTPIVASSDHAQSDATPSSLTMDGKRLALAINESWLSLTADGQDVLASGDFLKLSGQNKIECHAAKELVLVCGPSTIRLSPEGIEIIGPLVKINAD
ncbi:hypothetical protein PZA18_23960, partial [Chitinimonas sp. DQS-5]|nr:hypothetical protein [Parachitinimonas caeni]